MVFVPILREVPRIATVGRSTPAHVVFDGAVGATQGDGIVAIIGQANTQDVLSLGILALSGIVVEVEINSHSDSVRCITRPSHWQKQHVDRVVARSHSTPCRTAESVAIGAYFNVLRVLNLHEDFLKLAADDEFGRKLQDMNL